MSPRNGPPERRRNEAIRASEVLVIDETGAKLGVLPIAEALEIARSRDLDLVELGNNATPPVCRLLDYSKEKYEHDRAQRAAKHRTLAQHHVTEVQLRPAIGPHDMLTKAKIADRALAKGHRVRVKAFLHGRYISRPEVAQDLLTRFVDMVTHAMDVEAGNGDARHVIWVLKPINHAPIDAGSSAGDHAVETGPKEN
jgi:translation initiation factor IF-3